VQAHAAAALVNFSENCEQARPVAACDAFAHLRGSCMMPCCSCGLMLQKLA
jgi:hypothetical protein